MPLVTIWFGGLAVLFVAQFQTATSLSSLVLDPSYVAGQPWYSGAISNLGILVWSSGVAFAAAGGWVAHRIGRKSAARFLIGGAFATLVLLLDDAFRLHSGPIGSVAGSKTAAQAVVIAPVAIWLCASYSDIRRTRSYLLFAALASLAASVLVDLIYAPVGDARLLLEDGVKFLGILAWAQYFAITARDIAASAIDSGLAAATLPVAEDTMEEPVLRRVG